ncbi:MAG: hypothetical protein R3C44_15170 [Chloroflexota bacterium]
MVVGLLSAFPTGPWDRDRLPEGLYLPYDDPDNTWAALSARQSAGRRGRSIYWIIWNEPDIDDVDAPATLGRKP